MVNGHTFHCPDKPLVVICLDGSADEYLDVAIAHGLMPNFLTLSRQGYRGMVRGALPSFTNVNNSSIVTGTSPAIHGINGNFFYDPDLQAEVMMNSARYLRAETILAAAARAGRKVGVVTAKEKLRDILAHNLHGIAFSAEKAAQATQATHGIENAELTLELPTPNIYSAEASLFVFRAGVVLLKKGLADFLYLSTTDYMQHTYAPDAPESLAFYQAIDLELGRLAELGAIIGLTADHGMNAKIDAAGNPKVLFVETLLEEKFGPHFRVICPITDPYVKHHGALGSYVAVHIQNGIDHHEVQQWLAAQPGITEVHTKSQAKHLLEQPEDRLADLIVMSGRDVVVGRKREYHDLSVLDGTLRSHGGRYEEMVPMLISHPLNPEYSRRASGDPRNFEIFDFTINGTRISY